MYEHPLTGKIVEELDRFSHLQPEEGFRRHEWTAGAKNAWYALVGISASRPTQVSNFTIFRRSCKVRSASP